METWINLCTKQNTFLIIWATGFVPTAGLDLREGWTDNFVAEKWQICGGAKSALAFFWIDLHRFWQNKNWSLHTAQPKKVCKYLAKIQNEGSRSPWRKIIRSGGIRSPNPLRRVGWGTWLRWPGICFPTNVDLFHNKYEFGSQQIWNKHWANRKIICFCRWQN